MAAVRIGSSAVPIFIPEQALQSPKKEGSTLFSSTCKCCAQKCLPRRTRARRKLILAVLVMLFVLSILPFLFLTLLTNKIGQQTSLSKKDELSAEIREETYSDALQQSEEQNENQKNILSAANSQQTAELKKLVTFISQSSQTYRQQAVMEACRHAWLGYEQYAWGKDELKPISKKSSTWFDLALTLVDSLDTLWIMDMQPELEKAMMFMRDSFKVDVNRDVNLFETTIRVLGGLLSMYNLSHDELFLLKAKDLGERLLPAFSSKTAVPLSDVNLHTKVARHPKWGADSSTSEVTTIQLEFKELSRLVNESVYRDKALAVSMHVRSLEKRDNLVNYFINPNSGKFRPGVLTLGARADSYYEYLLKQYIQTNYTEPIFREEFEKAVQGITARLTRQTEKQKLWVVGEQSVSQAFLPKMDHLVCFYPGLLALASIHGFEPRHHYMSLAANITETCYEMYRAQPTGLAPEISHFHMSEQAKSPNAAGVKSGGAVSGGDLYVKTLDRHYLLRPETVESLFYLYRITGDTKYQEWGWEIFQSIEKYTKVPSGGYTSISNVLDQNNVQPRDKMESFFIGETLKYLFLLFDDTRTLLPLDKFVFNTEAHPLPIFNPTQKTN